MSNKPPPSPLGNTATDRVVAVLKSLAGATPVVGGALAEIIGAVIPRQRLDRVERYLQWLAEELERRTGGAMPPLDEEGLGLMEESLLEAARPVTDERRHRIAWLTSEGIAGGAGAAVKARKLLSLLRELDDYELALLDALNAHGFDASWKLRGVDGTASPSERKELQQLAALADLKLERLGLTYFSARMDRSTTPRPVYDAWGKMQGHRGVSAIGRELLLACGLATDNSKPLPADPFNTADN